MRRFYIGVLPIVALGWLVYSGSVSTLPVFAQSGVGAFLERSGGDSSNQITWLVPTNATLTFVSSFDEVVASYRDSGIGKIFPANSIPDMYQSISEVFYSDGRGLSSRISVDFSQTPQTLLMPPTIYSITNINNEYGSLGFVGFSHPTSRIILEITPYNNEIKTLETLADSRGEWQILPGSLLPGRYQARAFARFDSFESDWSQTLTITVLSPTDQLLQGIGQSTRQQFEQVIEGLPAPVRRAAQTIDEQSDTFSKVVLPSLLTLSTVATSGILVQNLIYFLFQLFTTLAQALGLVKKGQRMGYVYDAVTKMPLGRAIIRLYSSETHRLIETDVTSAAGTFSFLVPEGSYYLRVSKPGYVFPTRLILTKRDGRIDQIYSGGDIVVTDSQAVISVGVPLDPKKVVETGWQRLIRTIHPWLEPLNRWLLLVGFFLAVLAYSRDPVRLNALILGLYLIGFAYVLFRSIRVKREFGLVKLSLGGKPLPEIELNLVDTEYKRLVSRRVTDGRGRFSFLVPPGKYEIKVVTPGYSLDTGAIGSYKGDELVVTGEKNQTKRIIPTIAVRPA